jgi:hypothetical protein
VEHLAEVLTLTEATFVRDDSDRKGCFCQKLLSPFQPDAYDLVLGDNAVSVQVVTARRDNLN